MGVRGLGFVLYRVGRRSVRSVFVYDRGLGFVLYRVGRRSVRSVFVYDENYYV